MKFLSPRKQWTKKDTIALIGWIALPLIAGAIGSLFTAPNIPTWYATLAKPELNPPSWVFGPVWTVLFVLMGTAAFLVWRKGTHKRDVQFALSIFGVQLVLNTLWSIIFFGLQKPNYAFLEIILLWTAIAATIVVFRNVSKLAAWLLVPYIIWVSFASYLNYMIWMLN